MKPKALIIVPKTEANTAFLSSFPPDTQIEVIETDVYLQLLHGFEEAAKTKENTDSVDLGNWSDLGEPESPTQKDFDVLDYGPIDTEDGC